MCHNVGTGLRSGIDVRKIWEMEASRGSMFHRTAMLSVREHVADGGSVTDALRGERGYFPELVCEMVDVGERTGRLDEVFIRLGDHYDNVLRMRRAFLAGIAWPMFELSLGVGIIGVFIWILGLIWSGSGDPPITFFGLYGTRGLLIYAAIIAAIAGTFAAAAIGVRNGWISLSPLLRLLMGVPGIGHGLQAVAMSRLTWSLALATDSDIDAQRAVELSIRTTQNTYYTSRLDGIKQVIGRGGEFHEAFANAGVFPQDFLGALQAGEIGGRISESMEVLAKEYEERTKMFYRTMAIAAGIGVFLLVAALIIFMIFSLFFQYLNILEDASRI
jgi:type II secretory pathway component PulF